MCILIIVGDIGLVEMLMNTLVHINLRRLRTRILDVGKAVRVEALWSKWNIVAASYVSGLIFGKMLIVMIQHVLVITSCSLDRRISLFVPIIQFSNIFLTWVIRHSLPLGVVFVQILHYASHIMSLTRDVSWTSSKSRQILSLLVQCLYRSSRNLILTSDIGTS